MHGHQHHGHSHALPPMKGVLTWAIVITIGFVIAEFIAGYLGRSIALISDAVHNLIDLPTMALSWLAIRLAERPPTDEKTYGYHRAGILAAFTNAIVLVLVALWILWESFERLLAPVPVREDLMLWLAIVGLFVNGGITLALLRGRRDLNVRSIVIHNFGDALSNVAILIGALAIGRTGAYWVDPLLGMGIGVMVLWSSFGILRESSHILLEGTPRGIRPAEVAEAILAVPGVAEVHDIHVWTLGTDLHALSCHVRIPDMHMEESQRVLEAIRRTLAERFHVTHTTIQFERAGPPRNSILVIPGSVGSSPE
jgi:cobalt-zinc-cadmium efflux system protein